MTVLIGGSGSTGSSLLRTLINRHPDVFSGAELSLFNKEQVFERWPAVRGRLLRKRFGRLATLGWTPYLGTRLLHPEYGWQREELESVIRGSGSFEAFVTSYFERTLRASGARVWAEKTPSNAYTFPLFLERFPAGRVIQTARDPRDAAASLVRRGMSPLAAAGMWVYNSAAALRAAGGARYLLVRYEQLVKNPEAEARRICEFLQCAWTETLLEPDEPSGPGKLLSWGAQRTGAVTDKRVGAFSQSEPEAKARILTALSCVRVAPRHAEAKHFRQRSCTEVCEALGYPFEPAIDRRALRDLRRDRVREWTRRSVRSYPTGWGNFPITVEES